LSSTRSHTSAYASAMRRSAVRWMTSAERGFASSARRGDVSGSCEVRKDENFVSAAVSSVAVAPGRRESGVCCQLDVYMAKLTSGGRLWIARMTGARPHCSSSLPCCCQLSAWGPAYMLKRHGLDVRLDLRLQRLDARRGERERLEGVLRVSVVQVFRVFLGVTGQPHSPQGTRDS
jgi:hypothetical protein